MFAQASVAQADADHRRLGRQIPKSIFWRPIGAIQGDRLDGTKGHDDGNPDTAEDPLWKPLGAPDGMAGSSRPTTSLRRSPPGPPATPRWAAPSSSRSSCSTARTTSPRPTRTTRGDVDDRDVHLYSAEFDGAGQAGMTRNYVRVHRSRSATGASARKDSKTRPRARTAMSRIYLGVHWIMDQEDGTGAGRANRQVRGRELLPARARARLAQRWDLLVVAGLARFCRRRSV